MPSTVLYMSMSLDGFIAGPQVRPGHGLGDGGERLHDWVLPADEDLEDGAGAEGMARHLTGVDAEVFAELLTTGAVITGRATFEPAQGWGGDHHDGVPIHILSRHAKPAWAAEMAQVRYTADLAQAVRDAKDAAGERNVLVHGSSIAQRMLREGLLDEIEIHLVPVLLSGGTSLFGDLGIGPTELERLWTREGEAGVTHLRYRVRSV